MKRTLCAAACLAMLLASCGGGTSSPSPSQPSTLNAAAQRLVGGSPPVETGAEQNRRAQGLVPRSDSLVYTKIYVDEDDPNIRDVEFVARCSRTTCAVTRLNGEIITIDLFVGSFRIGDTLLTRNGITIALITEDGQKEIGSTLHDSAFSSYYTRDSAEPSEYSIRAGHAYGDSTGSAPSVGGTWRGMMTAVTTENDDLLLGDAVLRYSVSESGELLNAEFSNIVNYSRNRAYSKWPNVVFVNVPVRSDGTFNYGRTNTKIQGAFYGEDHAEATGIFEFSEMFGTFGTKRAR